MMEFFSGLRTMIFTDLRRGMFCFLIVIFLLQAAVACAADPDLSFLTQAEQDWLSRRTQPIRLAPDPGFSPVEIKGQNGELLGLAGDYIDLIEAMLGISFDVVWYESWAQSVREAQRGNVDLWSAVVLTPQRTKYMLFSTPYAELQPVFVVPESDSVDISFETLGRRRLVVVEGWFHQDLIENSYPEIRLSTVVSIKDGLIALQNGTADVFVSDTIEATYMIRTLNLKGLRIAGDAQLKSKELRMACRKDWPVFKTILEKTLARITVQQKEEISQRWASLVPQAAITQSRWSRGDSMITLGGILFFSSIFLFLLFASRRRMKKPPQRITVVFLLGLFCVLVVLSGGWIFRDLWLATTPRVIDLTSEERAWLDSLESPLIVAPDTSFAPIEWIDANGVFTGIAADYLRLVEKKLGIRFSIKQISNWSENVKAAKRREFDIWSAAAPTDERRQYMNFTHPHIRLKTALIVNRAELRGFTLETITTERVAVVRDYFTQDYLKQHFPAINLVPVADARAGLRALAFRQVDAVFSDVATASYVIKQEGIGSLEVRQNVESEFNLAIASRNDWPILSRILDKAVLSISPAEHRQIMEKWTGSSARNRIDVAQVVRVSLGGAALLIAVLFWSFSLKRLVQIRTKELGEAQQDLIQANNYITNIINSLSSVLIGVDQGGNITQWNLEAELVTGLPPKSAMGQPLDQAIPHFKDEMARVRKAIRSGQKQTDLRRSRIVNGVRRYEDIAIYPLLGKGGGGAVVRLDDVTDKVHLEEIMVQSEKMLSVGGLAAGMAHEINNPLAGMMQTATVLLNRLTADLPANERAAIEAGTTMSAIRSFHETRDIPKMLARICESGDRAAEIVANMLDFAHKDADSRSLQSLTELIDRSIDLAGSDYNLKKDYDFRQINIIREYEENLPLVSCGAGTIQQVILNLLRNGAEAMQGLKSSDGRKPCFILRVAKDNENGMVRIEVEDNGPGIDEEQCKRIFEPFYTTKLVGQGTGLGLSVSYFIITENHAGKMSVESRLGEGTRFTILLPTG